MPGITVRTRAHQLIFTIITIGGAVGISTPAQALPMFARKFDLPCSKCHTMIPRLTNFGYEFYKAGFRLPGKQPHPTNFTDIASLLADFRALRPSNKTGETW
jgi:hypothetical protein